MRSLTFFLSLCLMASSAVGLPTKSLSAINSTIHIRNAGQPYYDLGLSMPLCVPTDGWNLCTTTIVGANGLDKAWVWLFDYQCNMWHFDSEADWNALGQGSYQIPPKQLSVPVTVHSDQNTFMQNYIDNDFWVETNGWQQNWNGDSRYWDAGWNAGESMSVYELKRMSWICVE